IIEESGERMLNIINDLMNISKIEAGQMGVSVSEININAQLEYLFSFFKPEAERRGLNLSLVNTLESKNVIIISDQEKLYAILLNLIKNAIKYTNKGSVEFGFSFCSDNSTASTASTSSATEESSTEESAKEESAKELEFYVKDTGIGIDNYQLEAIFERFVQADLSLSKPYEGVGLGLSIARAYVLMLGGKIRVESEVGKGSHFYFTIPYNYTKKEISTTNDIVSETMSERKGGNLKILIVEDEEVANTYLSILVEDIGKEILHAENGVKAVEICRQNQDIDLILMDIKMPEMNGYEATRQIRKTNKDVVVVAQTAFALMGAAKKQLKPDVMTILLNLFKRKYYFL
ncbi:MAG: response regulator, partial [Bacteroidales bacterium]|nr:response regulator [Bacteroidales bacterium]